MYKRRRRQPSGFVNIVALQKAGQDAEMFRANADPDIAHIGKTLGRVLASLMQKRDARTEQNTKKVFYTFADATAPKDE